MLEKNYVRKLCEAIVAQAMDDYGQLRKSGQNVASEKSVTYGIEEIEDFFRSGYGNAIVRSGLGLRNMDGTDFIRAAKRGVQANLTSILTNGGE